MYSKFSFWEVFCRYTARNLVLKHDFRAYIQQYTSPNENCAYDYPHSIALVTFFLQKDGENVVCCAYVQWLPAA